MNIQAQIQKITPAVATLMLAKNKKNRGLSDRIVRTYAEDMAAGRWLQTGEAVKFSEDGSLQDGQHRLKAIIKSGATVDIMVITGLPNESQTAMDSGRKRTSGDAFSLHGIPNALTAAAVTRLIIRVETDTLSAGSISHSSTGILERYQQDKIALDYIDTATQMGCAISYTTGLSATCFGFAWWKIAAIDGVAAANAFTGAIHSSLYDSQDDPRNALQRRLSRAQREKARLSQQETVATILHAYDLYRTGKKTAKLPLREKIPVRYTLPTGYAPGKQA